MYKVLISDKMDALAAEVFENNNITVDVRTGLSPEELAEIIGDYHGLAVRSSTVVTPALLSKAKNLKVIGRAGIGVDNIDIDAATEAGIVVMNTPFGNSITTAEHAIAMMFALARNIPQAHVSTHQGKWEKSKFMGAELYGKTLGVIGCGNIGSIVANRARGLKMHVIAYDPFLSDEQAASMGVEKTDLDTVLARADFITLHVPKNDKTANLLNRQTLAKTKKGVRIINCARGGIINEKDLKDALDSGHVAGAALDVYEVEPAKDNILFGHDKVVCTPHLGASTTEAQVNVAQQVAEQISDFLQNGAVTNALNMASISAEEAPLLAPYIKLATQIGSFAGQITDHAINAVDIEYIGDVTELNTKPLTASLLAWLLKPLLDNVNMVNAPKVAEARGITVSETKTGKSRMLTTGIRLSVTTESRSRDVTGTLFGGRDPRIVNIEGVPVEAIVSPHMIYLLNEDTPGLIGGVGTILGGAGYNISDFRLGRQKDSGTAVAVISLDEALSEDVLTKLRALPQVRKLKALTFKS